MTFAMLCERRPPSLNKGPNHKFQAAIRDQARQVWLGKPLLTGRLYARIVWLHSETRGDVDNVAKNILDALKGTVLQDDASIAECLTCAIDLRENYEVVEDTLPSDAPQELAGELLNMTAALPKHALYIEIGTAAAPRIVFGPVHGESR